MDTYITGAVVRELREKRGLTQASLAEMLHISDKTVSKWETAKGLPDISLVEPLAQALGVSVIELMQGERITNRNLSGNMQRCRFYVCPICGNIVHTLGEAVISCCGVTLPPLVAEECDGEHLIEMQSVEDEKFVTLSHPMTKGHYISFLAYVTPDRCQIVKLYPEGEAQARLPVRRLGTVYAYCNRHGLFKLKP